MRRPAHFKHIKSCFLAVFSCSVYDFETKPDSVDVNAAINDFGDSVDTYIDAGPCSLGQPSTIVWLMDKEVEIIRQGAISVEKIKEVLEC